MSKKIITPFSIEEWKNGAKADGTINDWNFLAFHNEEQAYLFLEENEQLVKDYLMIE